MTDRENRRRAAGYGLTTAQTAGLTDAKALIEAAAIAREWLGGDPYDWDRLRVVRDAELAEAQRLAQKNPPPIEAIRVNRDTGEIVGP